MSKNVIVSNRLPVGLTVAEYFRDGSGDGQGKDV